MFSARSAAMDADYLRAGPAAGKNVAVEAFIRYFAFKVAFNVNVTCAAFLAAAG